MTSIVDLTNTPTIFNNSLKNTFNQDKIKHFSPTEEDKSSNEYFSDPRSGSISINISSLEKKKINTGNIIKSLRKSIIDSKKYNSNFIQDLENNNSNNNSNIDNNCEYENWTDDMEDEILNLSEICIDDSNDINNKANFYIKYGKIIQVSLIVLGVSSVYISSSSIPEIIKNNINIVLGASSAIISSVYSLFSFSKKGIKLKEISYDLSNLSRIIRCELFKPTLKRDNITNFLIFIQTTRDKLLKKVDIE